MASWLADKSFLNVVKESWNGGKDWLEGVQEFNEKTQF